jgi:hypothetical protein
METPRSGGMLAVMRENRSESVRVGEGLGAAVARGALVREAVTLARAFGEVTHRRPRKWRRERASGLLVPDPESYEIVDVDRGWNLITNAGRIFLHTQGYGTSGLGANGLNWIANSNDAVTETATSTVLSAEIAANGLTRAQGTVTLPTGAGNQTTISKLFTASGAQSAQKSALFTASSAGTMCHVLAYSSQKTLASGDTLTVTFTITLG